MTHAEKQGGDGGDALPDIDITTEHGRVERMSDECVWANIDGNDFYFESDSGVTVQHQANPPKPAPLADGWIACADRLPDAGVLVLLLHQCASWGREPWKHTIGQVVDNGETWNWADENDTDQDWELVTHWRPLPPPPALSACPP